jgi:hypothetical protein
MQTIVSVIRRALWYLFVGTTDTSGKWKVSVETWLGAARGALMVFLATSAGDLIVSMLNMVDAVDFGWLDSAVSSGIFAAAEFVRRWQKNYAANQDDGTPEEPANQWPPNWPAVNPINFGDAEEGDR